MPIYDYKCKKCGEQFEILIRGKEKPSCPKCGSKSLKKLISGFAVISGKPPYCGCAAHGGERCRPSECRCGGCRG